MLFKTLGCAVQAVAPRARICDSRRVKVRQGLRAPWLIPVIHVLHSPWYEGFPTISTEFSPASPCRWLRTAFVHEWNLVGRKKTKGLHKKVRRMERMG